MIVGHIGGAGAPYEIQKSLRFRASASAYLSKSMVAGVGVNDTSQDIKTISFWVKRGELGRIQGLIQSYFSSTNRCVIDFDATDHLVLYAMLNSVLLYHKVSTAVFRDVSAHYHICVVLNKAAAIASERNRIYVNGVELTSFSTDTNASSGAAALWIQRPSTGTWTQYAGVDPASAAYYLDGYLSEINFVDGQALAPTDFGEFNADGVWVPKKYTGTYGTNGFYLPFSDGSSLANLTADKSGNGNNWTANNISLTAGTTYDWMDDTPTNNFATLNAIYTGKSTLSNANLTASGTTDLPTIIPDSGTWYFERGGVSQTWTPPAAFPSGAGDYNFGQRPWQSTGPTGGQKALCTKNLPLVAIANPRKHFDIVLHTGTGASQTINGLSFTPDFVWVKCRNNGTPSHLLVDRNRGNGIALYSNSTGTEVSSTGYPQLTSDGFSVDGSATWANGSGWTFVDWFWKAGGAAVTNNAGSITSQVSANTQAGFSIVTYTGTGANATVGHGLGVAPKMVIVKRRNGAVNWVVGGNSIGTNWASILILNLTDAITTSTSFNGPPTSGLINLGTSAATNTSTATYVAYCFAEVPGFSKIGSYIGNGSTDGPFVWCGFRPRFILVKMSSSTGDWRIFDTARNTYNVTNSVLFPNLTDAEVTSSLVDIDVVSNGFKLRNSLSTLNATSGTYIFLAIAEQPFNTPSNAR